MSCLLNTRREPVQFAMHLKTPKKTISLYPSGSTFYGKNASITTQILCCSGTTVISTTPITLNSEKVIFSSTKFTKRKKWKYLSSKPM